MPGWFHVAAQDALEAEHHLVLMRPRPPDIQDEHPARARQIQARAGRLCGRQQHAHLQCRFTSSRSHLQSTSLERRPPPD